MALTNAPNVMQGNTHVTGTLTCGGLIPPDGSIGGDAMDTSDPVPSAAQVQRYRGLLVQESASAEGDETRIVGVVLGLTGVIRGFKCTQVVPAVGVAIAEFDLLVNGVSVLTGVVELNSATAAYEIKSGVISDDDLVVGDVIEISLDHTTGGGTAPLGCAAFVEWDEDPV